MSKKSMFNIIKVTSIEIVNNKSRVSELMQILIVQIKFYFFVKLFRLES